MTITLRINGSDVPLTAAYSIMFVEVPNAPPEPVLYFRGKRVTDRWELAFEHGQAADPNPNANTA